MRRVFIDTEFTDHIFADLISIGLVDEMGRSFYGENQDYASNHCSEFTKTVVVPQLGKRPECIHTRDGLRAALLQWFKHYETTGAIICIDFDGDWTLFCELMEKNVPDFLTVLNIYPHIDKRVREQYHRDTGLSRHHALNDAIANKFAYRPTN